MKRIALLSVVILGVFGSGVVLAAPSGVSRNVVATGVSGDVNIEAKGPVEVRHAIVTVEPGGTTGWISWPGALVATLKAGDLGYRNASEQDCAERTLAAGDSFVIPSGSVFEVVNPGADTTEVHTVAFLPPGQNLKAEDKPANC
jgi:quercetin dioxygenase-like cupin family protein